MRSCTGPFRLATGSATIGTIGVAAAVRYVEFWPSQWTADDDVIDRDVVRRAVADTARALYPGSVVDADAGLCTSTFRDCAGRT